MIYKNKKGFTLVELLAVIVVLIVILVIAILAIRNSINNAKENALKSNSLSYIKAANDKASLSKNDDTPINYGIFTVSELNNLGVNVSGTKPDSGFLLFSNYEVSCGCLKYGKATVKKDGDTYTIKNKGTCNVDNFTCNNYSSPEDATYSYVGKAEKYVAPVAGTYLLQVWGAQGGGNQVDGIAELGVGGAGGYASGLITLAKGDVLYVNVGGQGLTSTEGIAKGGFNGGGASWASSTGEPAGGGGGATDIRVANNDLLSRVIVAGGGGGGGEDKEVGGYAGGTSGGTSYGGTQTAASGGATFGLGANTACDGGGGGGGWYGGGTNGGSQTVPTSNNSCDTNSTSSGGSGYIFTESSTLVTGYKVDSSYQLEDAYMKSGNEAMPNHSGRTNMIGNTGNGYARISLVGSSGEADVAVEGNFDELFKDYKKVEYIQSHGTEYILTNIVPDQDYGFKIDFETSNNTSGSGYGTMFGSRLGSKNREFHLTTYNSPSGTFRYYNQSYTGYITKDTRQTIELKNKYYELKNGASYYLETYTFSAPVPITIFTLNENGSKTQYGSLKLYDLYFYNKGDTVAHFIPCYNTKNSEIGLCETYTGNFYKNSGTGTFDKGSDI